MINDTPVSTVRRPRARLVALAVALVASSLATLAPTGVIEAVPPAANPADVSAAIRYNASGNVIGSVVRSLVNIDDNVTTYPGAFPLNFFGTKYDNLCISANGGAFLVNTAPIVTDATSTIARGGCSASYDYSTSYMAMETSSPFISVLATDHDTGNDVSVTPTWLTADTAISSIVGAAGTVTVTTSTPHGFVPNAEVIIAGTTAFNGTRTVATVTSSTEFTYSNATTGTESAGTVARKRVYGALSTVTGDGTTVTVTTGAAHKLGTGDYITFAGTGITAIDDKHFQVTRTGATTLTFPQPAGFNAATAVNLTADHKWFMSDGYGAIGQIYYGTATVDGRSAMVITWYRVPMYGDDNSQAKFSTIQLVFVKKNTGDAAVGWDFDVEFNYGTMTDDEDGYTAYGPTAEEGDNSNTYPPESSRRWGIGWANYRTTSALSSIRVDYCSVRCMVTITTSTPHGLKSGDLIYTTDVNSAATPNGASLQGQYMRTLSGTTGTTILAVVPGKYTGTYDNTAGAIDLTSDATSLKLSDDYEIFPYTWIGDLVEQSAGTSTRMTSNNMNAPTVPGRYTFQMIGGVTVGFERPSMGRPSAPTRLTAYYYHYPYDPTKATVSWYPSENTGGSAITSYTITMVPATGSPCVVNVPGVFKCTFEGLVSGVSYKIEAFATNSIGDSNVSVVDIGWDPGTPPESTTATTTGPVSEPKPFVLENGREPQLAPGKAVMYVGGEPIDLNIAPATLPGTNVRVLRMSSGGTTPAGSGGKFEMTIGGDCPTCGISQDNSGNNVLGMEQAAAVRVGGYGFGPGSQVNVFVSSTIRLIGFFKADGDGAFLGTVKVPSDLPRGNHTIQVSGFTADNVIRSVSVGITVNRATPSGCRVVRKKGKKPVTVCPKKPAAKKVVKKK